jgi:hypothetical protein
MGLDAGLLASFRFLVESSGDLGATLKARGLYNTFQFALRLSPQVHRKIEAIPSGILSGDAVDFEGLEAFSTYLHETIHWWQHIGSTYGLMLSLSHPTEAHANHKHLINLAAQVGFKKPIRTLIEQLDEGYDPGTPSGLANTIVNNSFDISAFRRLTFSPDSARAVIGDPLFECVGHAYEIAYGNNVLLLGDSADPQHKVICHPREWEPGFAVVKAAKTPGFFYGSDVRLAPLGARAIFEGQARFGQLQYLFFATGMKLTWDNVRELGLLEGIYGEAFNCFLEFSALPWPDSIDHPTVGLFLLICDMAINPGTGFPFSPKSFASFINDTDPGQRFISLSRMVVLKCPNVANAICNYTRSEYEAVSKELASALVLDAPLDIVKTVTNWVKISESLQALMGEYASFKYSPGNLVPRLLLSHFLAFAEDKLSTPEFFCWPGAWMAGERVCQRSANIFEKHSALFMDKADDDGLFPRVFSHRREEDVHETFNSFYASCVVYDMTYQWIVKPGKFIYDYRWLSQEGAQSDLKSFAERHFEMIYGIHPDKVELLSQ